MQRAFDESAPKPAKKPRYSAFTEEAPTVEKPKEPPVKTGGAEPEDERTTGVRQVSREAMAEERRAAEYKVGEGASPDEMKHVGRQAIASGVDPEQHLQMMENRGEAVSGSDMAILAAHDDALMKAADQARDTARANPENTDLKAAAQTAAATEKKWYDRISKYRTEWQKIGTAQQGEVDVDTGSFTSMQRYFEKTNNRPLEEGSKEAEIIQGHVDRIKDLENRLAERDKEIAQRAKSQSAARPKAAVKTKLPTDPAELAKHFAKRRADGSLYGGKPMPAEAGAVRIRPGDPQFTLDELKAIGNHANTYFAKINPKTGRTFETADVVSRTASDLGLSSDEVLHAFSRNKTAPKAITDQMYAERSARRQAKKDAMAFVEGANTHPAIKVIGSVPSLWRSTKVFGHGTVGMTTHGGPNLFMPFSERAVYWPGQVKQMAMALQAGKGSMLRSEIIHEKMLTDIENHPLYNTARMGGLKVDVYRAQDDIQTYARFLGGATTPIRRLEKPVALIARLSKRGDMGMDVLKWARMKDFAQKWEQSSIKTPEMAKELSNWVNHAWGSSDTKLGKPGGILFSPSLQGAHWARVIGDPAKTIATYADIRFNKGRNTTPEKAAIAKMRMKRAAEFAGVYGGVLLVNQAMLKANGQKDDVNFFNPTQADWMQPKWNGRTLGMGLSQGPIHVLSQVARDVKDSDARRLAQDVFRYGQGKLHPAIGTALEVGMRKDYFGRPLPFASQEMKNKAIATGRPDKQPISTSEYLWTLSPIPVEGIAREYFESMRDNGANMSETLRMWNAFKAAGESAPLELMGVRIGHTPKPFVRQGGSRPPKDPDADPYDLAEKRRDAAERRREKVLER